jgi:hypothetical protein
MLMRGSSHTARPAYLHWPREPWSSIAAATPRVQLQAPCDCRPEASPGSAERMILP